MSTSCAANDLSQRRLVQVLVVGAEADRWRVEAKRRDVTVSALVRHAVRELLRNSPRDLPEAIVEEAR